METLLTEIIRTISVQLGGKSYGVEFSNDVFTIQPFWDENDDEVNFHYKPLDIKVSWYKHIGRAMEFSREITLDICREILNNCLDSIKKNSDESTN